MVYEGQGESTTGFSAKLVAEDGVEYALAGVMKVGRVADCDITIDDPRVSRAHALITVEGERVTLEDLGSANGSRINNKRTEGITELADGDSVSFENHQFKIVISGLEIDSDLTVINASYDSDETIVGAYTPPVPEEPPKPAPGPVVASDTSNLPGSWVESDDDGQHTRILMPGAADEVAAAVAAMSSKSSQRGSDEVHLQVIEDGVPGQRFELEVSGGDEPDVWEIGRGASCEISLSTPSVSTRHAQLIHQNDRWRLVNLVSANGIYVNEEKRLTAYLADGDKIRLGMANLVFHTAAGAPAKRRPAAVSGAVADSEPGGRSKGLVIAVVLAVVIGVAFLAYQM